jgi:hypothetical protein
MTRDKDFKKIVRARMERTGESYAAARAQLADHTWRYHGGTCWETTSVRSVLAFLDVRAPHTKEPPTEALLFGIGGGIGCAYFVFEYGDFKALFIGARHLTPDVDFPVDIVTRLGLPAKITRSKTDKAIREGLPAIVWCDRWFEPGMPMEHVIVVHAVEDEVAHVSDMPAVPITLSMKDLAASRQRMPTRKKKLQVMTIERGPADFETAVDAGLAACKRVLLDPPMSNFGLSALTKWADLLVHEKDKKSWRKVFHTPRHLHEALGRVFYWIEIFGTGGGAQRGMFADFLEEAARINGKRPLAVLAPRYREVARAWTELAHAATEVTPALKKSRQLMIDRDRAYRAGKEIPQRSIEPEPIDDAILSDLSERIRSIVKLETELARAL